MLRDPSAPPSARPAPERPSTERPSPGNYTAPPSAPSSAPATITPATPAADIPRPTTSALRPGFSRLPQPPGSTPVDDAEEAADDRTRRYEQALTDPVVRDLLKRFEADIIAREPGDLDQWRERLKKS